VVSALSRRGACWGRGVRLVDFAMSNGEKGGFLDCILPRISRLHGIIGVELLLFFVMSFLCFTLLLYTGTPLSGTILHCPRGFSFSFSFLSLVKITAMSYSYLVLFFNLFPTFGVTLGLFMINGL